MPSFCRKLCATLRASDSRLRSEIDDGLRIESITSSEPILDSLNCSRPKNGEQCNSASGTWPW
jgi:hypothetical protein